MVTVCKIINKREILKQISDVREIIKYSKNKGTSARYKYGWRCCYVQKHAGNSEMIIGKK